MTRNSLRPIAACTFLMLAVAMVAWGRNGVVTTKDGKTFEGDITEKPQSVDVIMKGNVPVSLQRANVEKVEYLPDMKTQFEQRMAKLGKTDARGRIELAKWAADNKEYGLAITALDAALAIDPNNEQARQMMKIVQAKQQSEKKNAPKTAPPPAGEPPTDGAMADPADAKGKPDGAARGKKLRLVTPAEINRIRQLEMQDGEKVQIRLNAGVKQRYLASSEFTPEQFNKMTPQEQGFQILNNGSSKLHSDVIIASDPASVAQFKSIVQRNVLPGCASMQCHGGTNAGSFKLHNPAGKDIDLYTNFLLMQAYTTTIDGKEYSMIDRARPDNSLLLHFGMPQADSPAPHPKAQNFRPMFKGMNDPKYKQIVEWASKTLAPVAPEYDIDLSKPPGGGSTTRPAGGKEAEPGEPRPAR